MNFIQLHPLAVFLLSCGLLWLAAQLGVRLLKRQPNLEGEFREDFAMLLPATLTLLGLIIGFSFSMAITRYDVRKTYEEAEANAIGTAYVRADLIPTADGAKLRMLLRDYLDQRINYYSIVDDQELKAVNVRIAQLQEGLWTTVKAPALAQPTPIAALAVASINDVLNSQGYTQAAWLNRIPTSAWILMMAIAFCCNVMIGYGARKTGARAKFLMILPLVLSIAFLLIADIDTPRRGLIRVVPQNLLLLAQSLPPR